jgi:hypothetical protein
MQYIFTLLALFHLGRAKINSNVLKLKTSWQNNGSKTDKPFFRQEVLLSPA